MKYLAYQDVREQVYCELTETGLPVYVVRKPGYVTKFAYLQVGFGGGDLAADYASERYAFPEGTAHFMEHKMFDNPDGTNSSELFAANGASCNAVTAAESTAFYFSCTEKFEENLKTLLKTVSEPHFTGESVEKERGIIGQEIKMRGDQPGNIARRGLTELLVRSHPLKLDVAGTEESIAEITPELLYLCHRIYYTPSNMCLVIVGDFGPDEIFEFVCKNFSLKSAVPPQRAGKTDETFAPLAARGEKPFASPLPVFAIGNVAPSPERGRELMKFSAKSSIASAAILHTSARFLPELYAAGKIFGISAMPEAYSGLYFNGLLCTAPDPEVVFTELTDEFTRAAKDGVDSDMFRRVKKASFGQHIRGFDSYSGIAQTIASWRRHGFDGLRVPEVVDAVTEDEVNAQLRDFFKPESFAMFVLKPQNAPDFASMFGGAV
ncbi:MAG: insulinase family protein [Oscillospiraceae bacterium]|jgi:predicted Zn-dependent peptidase|nr:insulinase family protein [Oscillospiraceae bacterium]